MCVALGGGRRLFSPTPTQQIKCMFSLYIGESLPAGPRDPTSALWCLCLQTGWCLIVSTTLWYLHIHHKALCECLLFILTFSATEQRFVLSWRGWGRSPRDDTGLVGGNKLVTSALQRHLPLLVTMAFLFPTV